MLDRRRARRTVERTNCAGWILKRLCEDSTGESHLVRCVHNFRLTEHRGKALIRGSTRESERPHWYHRVKPTVNRSVLEAGITLAAVRDYFPEKSEEMRGGRGNQSGPGAEVDRVLYAAVREVLQQESELTEIGAVVESPITLQAWLTLPSVRASSSKPTLLRIIFC